MRIHFLLQRREAPSEIVQEASCILASRGFEVRSVIPEEVLLRLDTSDVGDDLYLLKSYSALALSLAGVLEQRGARLLNSFSGCYAARNKLLAAQLLAQGGIPAPRSWTTADPTLLRHLLRAHPLILKSYMGWRGEGVSVVEDEHDLARLRPFAASVIVQEYLVGDGEDLRVYVAGEHVFAVKKAFSANSFCRPGRPVAVAPTVRDIALRCGRLFGLSLFGLDLIETADGPKVVDVNYFPGFKGVAGAAECVADHIARVAAENLVSARCDARLGMEVYP